VSKDLGSPDSVLGVRFDDVYLRRQVVLSVATLVATLLPAHRLQEAQRRGGHLSLPKQHDVAQIN
jgi:hypothetical protein